MKTATGMLLIVAVCISAVGVSGAQTPGASSSKESTQVPEGTFSIVLGAPAETTTSIGKPLVIKVTVANVSNHDVIFPALALEDTRNPFRFEIRDSVGKEVPLRKPYHLSNPPKPEELSMGSQRGDFMRPGTSETFDLDLQKPFALDQPGKYTVQAKLRLGPEKIMIKSNVITINVGP